MIDSLPSVLRRLRQQLDTNTVVPNTISLRVAQVTAVTGLTVTLVLGGDTANPIAGVPRYIHYTPTVGDVVDVIQVGGSLRVLGRLAR